MTISLKPLLFSGEGRNPGAADQAASGLGWAPAFAGEQWRSNRERDR